MPGGTSRTTAEAADGPTVAVYRRYFLPRSETFVRDHLLHMPRYRLVPVASELLEDSLDVPGMTPVVVDGRPPAPRVAAAVLRRLRRPPQQVDAPALAHSLRRTGARLVHAHFGTDAVWALDGVRLARLPLVTTFHGFDATMDDERLQETYVGALLVRRRVELVRRCAAVITVSDHLRDVLVARGADPARLHVVPCGVDTGAVRATPSPGPGAPVLFVGRLVEKKGLGDLLAALAGLPRPPCLLVAGDGPLRAALERQALRLRLEVRFLGMVDSTEVATLMDRCALLAMPSRRAADGDSEGLPVTALEAGAHGRAVVGYRHSGIPQAVEDGRTGLLADEGDVAGLRDVLGRALGDAGLRSRLGAAARERVSAQFSLPSTLARVAAVYDAVLDGAR